MRKYYTVTKQDVGKNYFNNVNHHVPHNHCYGPKNCKVTVTDVCGYFQPCDVGKRIYSVPNASDDYILQIENDGQLTERARLERNRLAHTIAIMKNERAAVAAQITMMEEQIRSRKAWIYDADKEISRMETRFAESAEPLSILCNRSLQSDKEQEKEGE